MRIILMLAILNLFTLGLSAQAAGPDGLYLMTRMIMGSSLEIAGWYFKNGQVSNRPVGNLAQFDFKAAAAAAPNFTGTYSISGKNLIIKWANGKQSTSTYEPSDHNCFCWDMGIFCPAEHFSNNAKLDGVFSGGASAGYGRAANATTITLSSNGQYKLEQAGSVHSGISAGTQLYAGSSGSETGAYELSGTALTLKSGSGKSRQILSFPYDDGSTGPTPRRLFFDGEMLKRIR